MPHEHYIEVGANDYYEMGWKLGRCFAPYIKASIEEREYPAPDDDPYLFGVYEECYDRTRVRLPQVAEELCGFADGAGVDFWDMLRLATSDTPTNHCRERCTTIVANDGKLIGHNEDLKCNPDYLFVVKRALPHVTTLELCYADSLGGNSVSINSHGIVHTVNTLSHFDYRVGIPRNFIARWLSESSDPESDYADFCKMRRFYGYSHNFATKKGVYNIESSALQQAWTDVTEFPYCHTNHYLSDIDPRETECAIHCSTQRYKQAMDSARPHMEVGEMQDLLRSGSDETTDTIFNELTQAGVVVDLASSVAYIRLRNESERDWVPYNPDFP